MGEGRWGRRKRKKGGGEEEGLWMAATNGVGKGAVTVESSDRRNGVSKSSRHGAKRRSTVVACISAKMN